MNDNESKISIYEKLLAGVASAEEQRALARALALSQNERSRDPRVLLPLSSQRSAGPPHDDGSRLR